MLVLDDNLVLSLVSGLDFGDGHHDHVVVVAVADQLVPPALLAYRRALTWSKYQQLSNDEYRTGLTFHNGTVLIEHFRYPKL